MATTFKPIGRVNLHSEVLQQLTQAIQQGQWAPGCKLPGEMALAQQFGVSRTCIREVLKALVYAGLVVTRSGVGTFVRESHPEAGEDSDVLGLLSSPDYAELMEVRKLLEGQAAYWATERATPEELCELENILRDDTPLKEKHKRFHRKVGELSKNRLLIHLLEQLGNRCRNQRDLNFVMLPDKDRMEHWQVFEAIVSGSASRARQAMTRHIGYFWKKSVRSHDAGKNNTPPDPKDISK